MEDWNYWLETRKYVKHSKPRISWPKAKVTLEPNVPTTHCSVRLSRCAAGKKSLICQEGKSITPRRGNTLFCSSQQLTRLCLGPLQGFLSWHGTLQRPLARLVRCFRNYIESRAPSVKGAEVWGHCQAQPTQTLIIAFVCFCCHQNGGASPPWLLSTTPPDYNVLILGWCLLSHTPVLTRGFRWTTLAPQSTPSSPATSPSPPKTTSWNAA